MEGHFGQSPFSFSSFYGKEGEEEVIAAATVSSRLSFIKLAFRKVTQNMSLSDLILVVFLKFTSWVFAANCCALGYPPSPGCAWVKRGGGSHKGTPLCFGAAQTQLTERDTKKKMMMMLSLTLFVPRRVGKYNKKGHPIFRDSNAKIFVAKNNVGTDFVIL